MRNRGRKAWLVTWEHMGDHAKPERKIAVIFKSQLSGRRVRELVEFLYASLEYLPFEQLEIVFGLRSNPYPATFGSLKDGQAGLWMKFWSSRSSLGDRSIPSARTNKT